MTHPRSLARLARLTVVIYLCFAGWFFILAPWGEFWSVMVVAKAPWWLLRLADSPALRGALAGFGVLHFPVAVAWLGSPERPA